MNASLGAQYVRSMLLRTIEVDSRRIFPPAINYPIELPSQQILCKIIFCLPFFVSREFQLHVKEKTETVQPNLSSERKK